MSTLPTDLLDNVPKPEITSVTPDSNTPQCPSTTTDELYHRENFTESSPDETEINISNVTPKSSHPKTPVKKIPKPKQVASNLAKKDFATKRPSNSGIPLRMKSGSSTARTTTKTGTYLHAPPPKNTPAINKNTLEVQFKNNKKRLVQMHSELVEKQRPLLEMHKSLVRTKKQLEELGKHVVMDDLKLVTLKLDAKSLDVDDGAGESVPPQEAVDLKNSVDDIFDSFLKVCKRCLAKREDAVKMLECVSRAEIQPGEMMTELEIFRKEKTDLNKLVDSTITENQRKITEVISNWQKVNKGENKETEKKICDLEEQLRQSQKIIGELESNSALVNRKLEEKKINFEKTIGDMQEKMTKLEEELKKEKKTAADNLMKSRTLRSKVMDLESKHKESEERTSDTASKLRQLQEQMRKKEVQWIKEKDEFKKNEALLHQKFNEKQSQLNSRLEDLEASMKESKQQQKKTLEETEAVLSLKEKDIEGLLAEKMELEARNGELVAKTEELEAKIKELEEIKAKKKDSNTSQDFKGDATKWLELVEYQRKIALAQKTVNEQTEKINKMQSSLKAHTQLAVALKLEKDNAIKYSKRLRDLLQEARDDIDFKNKTIYKIHEKLVLKETDCEKLKTQLENLEMSSDYSSNAGRNFVTRCQLCKTPVNGRSECPSCSETESVYTTNVGKTYNCHHQYMSESLIGMSVKKVDNIRARIDNLKKMKLPTLPAKKRFTSSRVNCSWSNHSGQHATTFNKLREHIASRGRLYKILQQQADQSCEDFINLLKMTVSSSGENQVAELNPSNVTRVDAGVEFDRSPAESRANINVTRSYHAVSRYQAVPTNNQIYDEIDESFYSESEDNYVQ